MSEFLEDQKKKINPAYADVIGTESYERVQWFGEFERLTKELEAIHAIAISSGDADTTEHEDDTLTLRYVKRMAYTIQNGRDE